MIALVVAVTVTVAVAVVVMIVSAAMIVVVFVLAVVMAIVVANFTTVFAAVEIPLPSAVTAPVRALAANGEPAMVAETRIIGAINVSAEADRPVEPGSRSEEDSATKPCGTVVAEGGATVRRIVVIAIRTSRFNANVDGDLYFGPERCSGKAEKREEGEREKPQ